MTSISKNLYIDKLDDIVNKCNNTYHSKIKIKPVVIKHVDIFILVKNNKYPKFKVAYHVLK